MSGVFWETFDNAERQIYAIAALFVLYNCKNVDNLYTDADIYNAIGNQRVTRNRLSYSVHD